MEVFLAIDLARGPMVVVAGALSAVAVLMARHIVRVASGEGGEKDEKRLEN